MTVPAVTADAAAALAGGPGRRGGARPHAGLVRVDAGSPPPASGLTHPDVDRLRDRAPNVICLAHRDLVTAMQEPG
jgi:hypothetical protein